MAWTAAVRRDAIMTPSPSPLPRLQVDSLSAVKNGNTSLAIVVIDANALLSFESSGRLLALAISSSSPPRFVSVKEVLEEVRDRTARFHLAALPCSVDCIDPVDECLRKVVKFARETGDLHSLSDVDLKLLALTYMLEEQTYGSVHLRTRPLPVQVTQVRHVREPDLPGWGINVPNLEEWEQLSEEPDETFNQGSHILGLKKLSLNSFEQENIDEQDHVPKEACQKPNLHNGQVGNSHASPESISQEESAHDCPEANGFGHEDAVTNAAISFPGKGHDPSIQSVPGDEFSATLLRDAEQQEEGQDERDWRRSISRSTRRKQGRKAARDAARHVSITKADVKSTHGNHVPKTDKTSCEVVDSPCSDNYQCRSSLGNEDEDAWKALTDELNSAEDHQEESKSDEDCPSISESFHTDEEPPVSLFETGNVESWTLHPLSQSKVACVTADFSMQNVLLQMGLRVISPNGLQIQQIHRWALKCEACRNVTSDVGRIFCPKCGNGGTLYKVSITIGPNGVVHTGTRRRTNLRGTKYSIPQPKGGRQGISQNPILREDQLPQKMLRTKKKGSTPDFSSPAEIFATKSGGKAKMQPPIREALAIFSGKRNPNHCRSKLKR